MTMILQRWCVPLLVTMAAIACHEPATTTTFSPEAFNKNIVQAAKKKIRTGDIIMRSGRDFTSFRIRELSEQDKTYSHTGIAAVIDTNVLIYHIIPPDVGENPADTIMRFDTLEHFLDPNKHFGFGIVRYDLDPTEITKAMQYTHALYTRHIAFDHLFDLRTPDKMYCSEMIDDILSNATNGRISLVRNTFDTANAKRVAKYLRAPLAAVMIRKYIPIDHVNNHPNCTTIAKYNFSTH